MMSFFDIVGRHFIFIIQKCLHFKEKEKGRLLHVCLHCMCSSCCGKYMNGQLQASFFVVTDIRQH